MNYQALVVPRETPTTLREIKRALLTYDKVIVLDPNDRDMMPSSLIMPAVAGLPFFPQMNLGPARPLGKTADYDDFSQRTIDKCTEAIQQGVLEITTTHKPRLPQGILALAAGPVDRDYPLNPVFVLSLYRRMASQTSLLELALSDGVASRKEDHARLHEIATRGIADASGSMGPPLPLVSDPAIEESVREAATLVARSRIGVLIKIAAYCEIKQLVPLFGSSAY
jgi:hypothetical protein